MKFTTIVTAAVSSAIAVSGTPIHKREIGGVRLPLPFPLPCIFSLFLSLF